MTSPGCFSPNFRDTPYWWDASQPANGVETPLPTRTDILVIGGGYTGLHAAIQTVRTGHDTVVIDSAAIGSGCSTRNGGQISTSIKPGFSTLTSRYGETTARAIMAEGQASLDFTADFIRDEQIDCDFTVCGRFHGAHTPRHYERLARDSAQAHPVWNTEAFVVPKSDQHAELGTDFYHGGVVFPKHASVDPGKYHAGLVRAARAGGATLVPSCAATRIARNKNGFEVQTVRGVIEARKVVVATNGYTGDLTPQLQRRVIPIGSYIIATENLPADLVDRIFPTDRILSDTRRLVYYYRLSPDRKRVLFGGRVSLRETDPRVSGPILHRDLSAIFPELAVYRISHSWAGFVAFTFDTLMHAGEDNGLFHAMGYCGSGVGIASYLGMRVGQQVSGKPEGRTVFSEIPFKGRPYYSGNPWFRAPAVLAYRIMDKLGLP